MKEKDKEEKNLFAIWALITGILSPLFFTLIIPEALAVFLGIKGLRKAEELNGKGKGLAITGLVLGIIYVIVFFYNAGVTGL